MSWFRMFALSGTYSRKVWRELQLWATLWTKILIHDFSFFKSFSQNIIQAYKSGVYLKGNTSLGRWDFVGSFFFSVSTVTTIGRSHGILVWRKWCEIMIAQNYACLSHSIAAKGTGEEEKLGSVLEYSYSFSVAALFCIWWKI